jgi:hypothetical protein
VCESLNEVALALAEESHALLAAVRKLRALNVTFPSDRQILVLGLAALKTSLMATPWAREFEHLAPKDRRSWAPLVREWVARIESTFVQPHLGEVVGVTSSSAAEAAPADDPLAIPPFLRRDATPVEAAP